MNHDRIDWRETWTKEEYDSYVVEHGHSPTDLPRPGDHHRDERNRGVHHGYHSRGIG